MTVPQNRSRYPMRLALNALIEVTTELRRTQPNSPIVAAATKTIDKLIDDDLVDYDRQALN